MKPHLLYLRYVLRHKWFVLLAGRKTGVGLWALIIHDYTKFSRAEWGPYVRRFYAGNAGKEDKSKDPREFHNAFKHHWMVNQHHWEYWSESIGPTQMPNKYMKEMVADWMAASRALRGTWDVTEWYNQVKHKQRIHPQTRQQVEELLHKLGALVQ